jgi:hypothetical protein
MRSLLDVNFLVALADPGHVFHRAAFAWWRTREGNGWASCPATQAGFVRLLAQPRYPGHVSIGKAFAALDAMVHDQHHRFWVDDLDPSDPRVFDHGFIRGHRQVSDVLLLALAVRHGGRLVTFDRSIPLAAARGATPDHLAIL